MARPKLPAHLNKRVILLDYYRFRKEQHEKLVARIRHAAKLNPDLPLCLLAERFGMEETQIKHYTSDIPREPDGFAKYVGRSGT